MVEMLVFLVVGLVVGAGAGWFVGRASAPTPVADLGPELAAAQAALAAARERAVALDRDLAMAQERAAGYERELAGTREQHREFVDQQRREAVEREAVGVEKYQLLQEIAPIKAQLTAMQAAMVEMEKQRSAQHGQISEQIKHTRVTAEQSKAAAEMLNSALRNNSVRGAYGEIQLESIVEAAGMIRRVDFTTQESITADSGARRPDMVVKLPGGKEMAVDAKVPYAAYIESHRGDIDDSRRTALHKEHAKAVKAHVDSLAGKEYFTGLRTSPEFTVAFIPSDAILNTALDADPTLMDHAFAKGVVLATPVSLFAVLKSVAFTWKQEDLAENAREVVEMGQELFRRLRKAAENAAKLGRAINGVVKDYNAFAGSLERSVLPQARRFDLLELPALPQLEDDARQFTSPEFAALADVERPEIGAIDPPSAKGVFEVGDEVG